MESSAEYQHLPLHTAVDVQRSYRLCLKSSVNVLLEALHYAVGVLIGIAANSSPAF